MTKEEQQAAILKALSAPQSYSVDGESVTQRSADDTLKLIKALTKTNVTTKNAMHAIGVAKISTPGTNER